MVLFWRGTKIEEVWKCNFDNSEWYSIIILLKLDSNYFWKDIPVTQTLTIEEGAVPVHQKTKDQRLSHEQSVAAEDTSG